MRMSAFCDARISGSEALITSSDPTPVDSFSFLYNQSYFQPSFGSWREPHPLSRCASASNIRDDADKHPMHSRRIAFITSSQDDTEHAINNKKSLPRDSKYDLPSFENNDQILFDIEPQLNYLNNAYKLLVDHEKKSLRSDDDSLCNFQDEDIVSLCSSDWKF